MTRTLTLPASDVELNPATGRYRLKGNPLSDVLRRPFLTEASNRPLDKINRPE